MTDVHTDSDERLTETPHRRLLPRQFTDWRGRYMIEGDPQQRWRDCRIVDVSSAGAGLELLDASPGETTGQRILLAIRIKGDVRHVNQERGDGLRVGIQFVELTEAERAYLESLAELDAHW